MGYDLHITRDAVWAESEDNPITDTEWLDYIANDPEFFVDDSNPGEIDPWAKWRGTGGMMYEKDDSPMFLWYEFHIVVTSPDHATIRKMIQIASTLNARVLGDEDEEYFPNGEVAYERYEKMGLLSRLWAWLRRQPTPERKLVRVVTRWDE